jgi:monoamine oxidase
MTHSPLFRQFIRTLQQARRQNLQADGRPQPLPRVQRQWTRRRFIRSATLAGGSALFTSTLSQATRGWSQQQPKIAIVGGGIAGLNAAYYLKKAGLSATVYEARRRLGGRILSVTDAVGPGLVSDLGGHFINSDHADMLQLVREFDLKLFNRVEDAQRFPFPETGYFFDGRLRSQAEVADQLRPLARQISRDAALIDRDFEQFAPQFDQQSVAEYLVTHANKIPKPFVRRLIENSIRTEYGVEPSQSSALQLLFNLPTVDGRDVDVLGNSDEVFVVEGGTGKLIDSLASVLKGQIQTRMRLTRLQSQSKGFRLTFANRQVVDADVVILAIPFPVLRTVDLQVELPPGLRRFINEVDLGSNEKLYAGFERKVWRRDQGFVMESWTDRGFSAAWDGTQRQTNRKDGALTFFLGGDEVKAAQASRARPLGRTLIQQFNGMIPGAQDAATDRFLLTQWTTDPLTQGGYTNFKPGQLLEFGEFLYVESENPDERQTVNVGNIVFAGEQLSDEFYGFMNGAAQTGRLAAEVVTRM